jgi:alkylation response protein AidB-like acyl-CoA dehydrogenase
MAENQNDAKDQAMELAEASRQTEWRFPSFTAELFRGNFRWDLMHPYPCQSPEDKAEGDEMLKKLEEVFDSDIDPIAIDKEGVYPQSGLDALAKIGTFGLKIPKEYGGLGLSVVNYGRILHYMGSYCQSTVTWISAHQSIGVPQPLKLRGTDEQKKKFLPRMAKGAVSAFALTEPGVGSDPAKMTTTAEPTPDGKHFILNGEKLWTTNGPDAEIFVVMAMTPPKIVKGKEKKQITAFIVENDMPGFEVAHRCQFMGLHGLSNGLLTFKDVKVPAENVIGDLGEGLKIALMTLNTGRLGIPAAAAGAAKRILKDCEKWVNERVQWGAPIGKHQSISKKIANQAATTFAMDSVVWLVCNYADEKTADIRLEAAIAKYFCTEAFWTTMDEYLQVRGGRGYESELSLYNRGEEPMPVERFIRDLRVARIFEGSTEIMQLIIAREAMDTHFKLIMPIMMPHLSKTKESKFSLMMKALKFYAVWYPKTWLPSRAKLNVKHLSAVNQDHLAYVNRTCKRLARSIFHTMGIYQQKLEKEQLILGDFVDIGVDLFVMAACQARAESLLAANPDDQSPQDLADLFCKNARRRIEGHFKALGDNDRSTLNHVADQLMDGKYRWLIKDIYADVPLKYRDWATKGRESAEASTEDDQKTVAAE